MYNGLGEVFHPRPTQKGTKKMSGWGGESYPMRWRWGASSGQRDGEPEDRKPLAGLVVKPLAGLVVPDQTFSTRPAASRARGFFFP